jgi:hypothetical protein
MGYNVSMRTYFLGFLAVFLLFVGNQAGIHWHLYDAIWSYDIFMHILGGLGIGLSIAAFLEMHTPGIADKRRIVMYGVILAGVLWELFEAHYNIAGAPVGTKAYYIDTAKDLIDDALGGFIAAFLKFPWR